MQYFQNVLINIFFIHEFQGAQKTNNTSDVRLPFFTQALPDFTSHYKQIFILFKFECMHGNLEEIQSR